MSKRSRSKTSKKAKSAMIQPEPSVASVKEVIPVHQQDFRLLVAVPATHLDHLPSRKKVLDCIEKACEGYTYDLYVGPADNNGWQTVVDQFNLVADRTVNENYDYVLIVESDVFIPANTLTHLLSLEVDVAAGVVKNHSYPNHPELHRLHKDFCCVAWFRNDKYHWFRSIKLDEVKDKILTFNDGPLLAATGCILIKRRVFESGIRFVNLLTKASYDVIFWKELPKRGFSGAADGFVICDQLGD